MYAWLWRWFEVGFEVFAGSVTLRIFSEGRRDL
jgi:hypothetical protein